VADLPDRRTRSGLASDEWVSGEAVPEVFLADGE
jgi:hypothetical protein